MPRAPGRPFQLHSIAFAFPGNPGAIPLRDPVTSRFLGDTPEWNAGGRSVAAAFVRGSRPRLRVRFARGSSNPRTAGPVTIGARTRNGPGVAELTVRLRFAASGISAPVDFALAGPVHDLVGRVDHEFDWYARDAGGERPLGTTRHEWLRAWKTPIPPSDWASLKEPREGPPGQPDVAWVYLPIMRWTCDWGTDSGSERALCDALLDALPRSGLRYAVPAWNVRDMLLQGGGYCGAFYRLFQALAGAQGVHLERRQLGVDWKIGRGKQARWCAIVVDTAGLNRTEPAEAASTFHDVDKRPVSRSRIETERVRRYRFWGIPGLVGDGHSLNFLQSGGHWYVYDASFQLRAELRGFKLPPANPTRSLPLSEQGNFKEAYLDKAVNFMLGSLQHDGKLYATEHPDPEAPSAPGKATRNGLSVKTALVDAARITFYWV
jgi:hypothetical protein